jgi:hypothetical protein
MAAPGRLAPSALAAARARREAAQRRRPPRSRSRDSRATGIAMVALVPVAAFAVLLLGSQLWGPFGGRVLDATGAPGAGGGVVALASPTPTVGASRAALPSSEPTTAPTTRPTSEPTSAPTPEPTTAPTASTVPWTRLPPHRATTPIVVATPTPPPTARPTAATAVGAVERFYQAAAAHDWETAVAMWSPSMQRRYPPQQWLIDRFKRTTRIEIPRLALLSADASAGTATVAVRLVEYRTVEPSPRSFAGSWDLVLVDGAWLLDQPHF